MKKLCLFSLILFFVIVSNSLSAQGSCTVGENFYTVTNPNAFDDSQWFQPGNAAAQVRLPITKNGLVTHIEFQTSLGAGSHRIAIYDNDGILLTEALPTSHPNPGGSLTPVLQVPFDTPISVSYGDTVWVTIKFAGSNNNIYLDPVGTSECRSTSSPYVNTFPSNLDGANFTPIPGSLAMHLVMEDCSVPIPGCIDPTACNFDPDATLDDGTCTYSDGITDCSGVCFNDSDGDGVCDENEVAGCTNVTACNFNPSATDPILFGETDACQWTCYAQCQQTDLDGDNDTDSSDLLIFLNDRYGQDFPYGNQADYTQDGLVRTDDLLSKLQCIGN